MLLSLGDKVFMLVNDEIMEFEFVKYNKVGTSAFIKRNGEDGELLIPLAEIIASKEEANAKKQFKKYELKQQKKIAMQIAKEIDEMSIKFF